jgi:hypothetical protein
VLQRAPRSSARHALRGGWLAALDRRFAGGGPLLGVTAFTSIQLYRSAGFRARVLPILLLPAALIAMTLWNAPAAHRLVLLGVALQLPAAYMPLLIAFLPAADEERTRWVFQTSPLGSPGNGREIALARQAALVSLATHVLLPSQLLAVVVLLLSSTGLVATAALASFSFGAGVLATRLALRDLPCLPFTEEREGTAVEMSDLLGIGLLLGLAGGLFALVAREPWALLPGALVALAAVRLLLRRAADAP